MNLLARAGGMFSFQHLSGLGLKRRAAAEEKPEDDKKGGEPEEDRRAEEEQPEHYEDDGKGKRAAKGEDNDGDEDEDEGRETARRAERGEPGDDGEDAEDEDDEEMKKAKAAGFGAALVSARRRGRLAERARIGRILSAKAAKGRIPAAAHLACNTGLSSAAAIALLGTLPAEQPLTGRLAGFAEAMRGAPKPPKASAEGGQQPTAGQALLTAAQELGKQIAAKKPSR